MPVPSIETKIFQAIKARVETLPMRLTHDIVWTDGPSYEPNPSQPYLRCTWTPNATQRQFIGSRDPHRRPGVLQIDVMGTLAQGAGVAREVAGQVALNFGTDLALDFEGVRVRVMKAPSIGPVFVGTHIQVPVLIELEAWA